MNREIMNTLSAADKKAQYDERAKRVLSQKIILAHILVNTVDEFAGMKPEDVVPLIEGEPYISVVPVEPGLTNIEKLSETNGEKIVGLNTENIEINEGMVRFDIIFYVRMKAGLSQVIINVEIQKDEPTKYCILNRGIFYVCRMVSSQKERDFLNSNYDDIKQVHSIWICMNMNENSLNHVHLVDDSIIGNHTCKGNVDLLNIIMIGLAKEIPEHDEKYELHRLLSTLLSNTLDVSEKLDIIEKEYNIPVNEELREDVNVMCNLGEGIEEEAMAKGEARGIKIGETRGEARGLAEGKARGLAEGINGLVDVLMELNTPKEIIVSKIMEKFSLTEAQAKKYTS